MNDNGLSHKVDGDKFSSDEWKLVPKGTMFFIENTSKGDTVLDVWANEEVKDDNKDNQLWIKGEEDDKGYFTLKNYESSKFLSFRGNQVAVRGNYLHTHI